MVWRKRVVPGLGEVADVLSEGEVVLVEDLPDVRLMSARSSFG